MTIEIVLDDGTTYMWANVPEETLDAIHTAIGSDPDTERS